MTTPIDFSEILPVSKNVYTFNPSIAHYRDDLYLCSYRAFVRYPQILQKTESYDYTEDYVTDPNHPWLGGIKGELWWNSEYGYDLTEFVMLKITQAGVVTLDINYLNSGIINSTQTEMINPGIMNGVDGRLLKLSDNKFIISYNVAISDKGMIIGGGKSCAEKCTLIATRIIQINPVNKSMILGDETILCPSISKNTEKNWSLSRVSDTDVSLSYSIESSHELYRLKIERDSVSCDEVHISQSAPFFIALKAYYNNQISISVSTPTIPIGGDPFVRISVGHIKYKWADLSIYPPGSPLVLFTQKMQRLEGLIVHPVAIYLMFLYTFDYRTGQLLSCSDMFSPKSNTLLCYPSGLSPCSGSPSGNIIISYGESDSRCKFMSVGQEWIESQLIKGDIIDPSIIKFKML